MKTAGWGQLFLFCIIIIIIFFKYIFYLFIYQSWPGILTSYDAYICITVMERKKAYHGL